MPSLGDAFTTKEARLTRQPTFVWPTIRADNARGLIDFLVRAFGFVEVVAHGTDGHVDHAEVAWPLGGGIMVGSHRDEGDDHWPIAPGSAGTYVVAEKIDELFEHAVAQGPTVVLSPRDTDHGSREFIVRDIEGNRWSFGTYRGAP